jgi:DNA-binding MarR family transcriptional regulator
MASNAQILSALVGKPNAMTCAEIAKELGLKANDVATPLKRMSEKEIPLVTKIESADGDTWVITEAGKNTVSPATEESEGLTEWQQFNDIGIQIGVNRDQAKLITDHVWTQDFTDMEWVVTGLAEQGLRRDIISRWANTWRGKQSLPITPRLKEIMDKVKKDGDPSLPPVTNSNQSDGSVRLRDYIIDANNNPLYVGEGLGDMEYADAIKLSTLRAAGAARSGSGGDAGNKQPKSDIDNAVALIQAINTLNGGGGAKKAVMMVPDGKGGFSMQEVDPGSTVIIPKTPEEEKPPVVPAGAWYLDPNDNTMKQAAPGQPIVIYKQPPVNAEGRQIPQQPTIIYHDDGNYETVEPGRPIILRGGPAKKAASTEMFSIPNEDGSPGAPISLDALDKWLDTKFKLEQHRQTIQHKEETHKMQMDIGKSLRDLATKGVRALGTMNGDEEDETTGGAEQNGGPEQNPGAEQQ